MRNIREGHMGCLDEQYISLDKCIHPHFILGFCHRWCPEFVFLFRLDATLLALRAFSFLFVVGASNLEYANTGLEAGARATNCAVAVGPLGLDRPGCPLVTLPGLLALSFFQLLPPFFLSSGWSVGQLAR
jgi:hypothetical protein